MQHAFNEPYFIRPEVDAFTLPAAGTVIPFPARADGSKWEYVSVCCTAGGPAFVGFSDDPSYAPFSFPQMLLANTVGPTLVNVSGYGYAASGVSDTIIAAVGIPRTEAKMNAPPQIIAGDTIATTSNGSEALATILNSPTVPIKYIIVTNQTAAVTLFAIGASGVSAVTDPQFAISLNSGPIYLNVIGMTHIAWTATTSGAICIAHVAY